MAFYAFLPDPLSVLAGVIETVADISPPPGSDARQTDLDRAQHKLIAAAGRVLQLANRKDD